MFAAPSFEAASSVSASAHSLLLVSKKGEIPGGLPKVFPAHLQDHGAIRGELGARLVMHGTPSRIYFGIGDLKRFDGLESAEWGENAGHLLAAENISEIQVQFPSELRDPDLVLNFLKGLALSGLKIDEFKTKSPSKKTGGLKKIRFVAPAQALPSAQTLSELTAIIGGIAFSREIAELPSRTADPQGIVDRFTQAVKGKVLEIEVWDEKRIAKEKMGLLQAVSQASSVPARFLIVRYGKDFGPKKPSLYLVGKGVTFDTGGINVKTGDWKGLIAMKKDMSGAANVLGAMLAIAAIRPDIRVVALAPLTFNSIGSKAINPGDIFRSYSGKTVEIQNTDAEGRLILADALHFAVREKADYIVDIATLTGACVVALGAHHTGVFSNHDGFREQVLETSGRCGEPGWPLPVSPRYGDELKSSLADLSNMGKNREGGASLAAAFLQNFIEQTPWVHLDIAGSDGLGDPAAAGAQVKSAGRMVHTLVALAQSLAAKKRK